MLRIHRHIRRGAVMLLLAAGAVVGGASPAEAGMPSVSLILTELGKRRAEELSFFLVVFLLSAWGVQGLWNFLRQDFPRLPRLSYRGAVAAVLLWGLALVVVLTMISGARELMTTAAWEPNGITHQLKSAGDDAAESPDRRRRMEHLERLWQDLRLYVATHDGTWPDDLSASGPLAQHPLAPAFSYIYRPPAADEKHAVPIVFEPELAADGRFVLWSDGRIEEERHGGGVQE